MNPPIPFIGLRICPGELTIPFIIIVQTVLAPDCHRFVKELLDFSRFLSRDSNQDGRFQHTP